MDTKFGYAILASLLLHGMIIAIWPRMRPLQIKEPIYLTRIALIEDLSPVEVNAENNLSQNHTPSQKNKNRSPDIIESGRKVTSQVLQTIGPRTWEKKSGHNDAFPQIRLPKQTIMPDEEDTVMVWPEEFGEYIQKDMPSLSSPPEGKRHKVDSAVLNPSDISDSTFLEEFPEERVSLQTPDITWDGSPRTWVAKPEHPPTYQGDEEGLVKVRFWVNEKGEVVNAIPIQKLSAGLEEKSLAYIFSWRFEPSPGIPLQEGVIRIHFKLERSTR